jgi:hypothetical protein
MEATLSVLASADAQACTAAIGATIAGITKVIRISYREQRVADRLPWGF